MAPMGRRYDATLRPPEVRAEVPGSRRALRFWCPELRDLSPAAGLWGGRTAVGIMVFYFTSSSGEWALGLRGSLPAAGCGGRRFLGLGPVAPPRRRRPFGPLAHWSVQMPWRPQASPGQVREGAEGLCPCGFCGRESFSSLSLRPPNAPPSWAELVGILTSPAPQASPLLLWPLSWLQSGSVSH